MRRREDALRVHAPGFVALCLFACSAKESERVEPRTRIGAGAGAVARLGRTLGSVVAIPIAEELAFRGFLQRRLIAADFEAVPQRSFTWPSLLGSAFAFGAAHQSLLAGTLAGLA